MATLNRIVKAMDYLVLGAAWLAGAAVVAMALHVSASVGSRFLFGRELPLTLELTTYYYMVFLTFLPLALLELRNAHIRVDVFTEMMPRKLRGSLNVAAMLTMTLFLALIAWRSGVNTYERAVGNEVVITGAAMLSIWPARMMVPIGFGIAALYTLLRLPGVVVESFREKTG